MYLGKVIFSFCLSGLDSPRINRILYSFLQIQSCSDMEDAIEPPLRFKCFNVPFSLLKVRVCDVFVSRTKSASK